MTRNEAYKQLEKDLDSIFGVGVGYVLSRDILVGNPIDYAEKFDRAIVATKNYADRVGLP